jgi:hypothetical protein
VDRNKGVPIAFKVGNESISNAYKMIYEILSGHSSNYMKYNELFNTSMEYLCTDGHHAYHKVYNTYKQYIKKHIIS